MSPEVSTLATRRHQVFPVLDAQEVQRVRRFGEPRTFEAGQHLATAGQRSEGMMVILHGNVRVTRKDVVGVEEHIVTYGPGSFLGGLEQLAGRPSLVEARAIGAVSAVVIAPERLRTLFIGEAALGERILRALILRRVLLLGKDLGAKMSSYLVDRIVGLDNAEVVPQANVSALEGQNGFLEAVRWRGGGLSEVRRPVHHLFLFIGAEPNSTWLAGAGVTLDRKGFVLTGGELGRRGLETSRSGIFAVGDVRSGSAKRVATAVGDGAQVVASLHQYLATGKGRQASTNFAAL